MEHNSLNDMHCAFLSTSVAVREHMACREYFINVMGNDKYLDNSGRQNILDALGRHFWLALNFGLDRI